MQKTTKLLFATIGAIAAVLSSPAFAGGSIKDAPTAAPFAWSGPYIGLHAGYGFTKFGGAYDEVGDLSRNLQDPRLGGLVGGVQAGWNWRNGSWVWGLEADYSASGQKFSFVDDEGSDQNGRVRALASLRGRLGLTNGPALVYITGGLAHGRASFEAIEAPGDRGKKTISATGVVVGAGLEYMIAPNVALRGEYLRYFFNKRGDITALTGDSDAEDRFVFRDNSVFRVGLNLMLGPQGQAQGGPITTNGHAWAGPYIGVHGGYGSANFGGSYDEVGDLSRNLQDPKVKGFVGGGQIGWNWSNGAWVWGIEADYSGAGQKFSFIDDEGSTQNGRIKSLGSVRGRLGVAAGQAMVYVTGGLAVGRASFEAIEDPVDRGKRTISASGIVVGGGLEWMLSPNLSLRGEYLHYNFNKKADITALTGDSDTEDRFELRDNNVFRLGVNLKFPNR